MKFALITSWLKMKWRLTFNAVEDRAAYAIMANTPAGQVVMQNLIDNVYCTICESNDPIALAFHNGQRALVHEMLRAIDMAQNDPKYKMQAIHVQMTEEVGNHGS